MRTLLMDDTVEDHGREVRVRAVRGPLWHYCNVSMAGVRSLGFWVKRHKSRSFGPALRRYCINLFLTSPSP